MGEVHFCSTPVVDVVVADVLQRMVQRSVELFEVFQLHPIVGEDVLVNCFGKAEVDRNFVKKRLGHEEPNEKEFILLVFFLLVVLANEVRNLVCVAFSEQLGFRLEEFFANAGEPLLAHPSSVASSGFIFAFEENFELLPVVERSKRLPGVFNDVVPSNGEQIRTFRERHLVGLDFVPQIAQFFAGAHLRKFRRLARWRSAHKQLSSELSHIDVGVKHTVRSFFGEEVVSNWAVGFAPQQRIVRHSLKFDLFETISH